MPQAFTIQGKLLHDTREAPEIIKDSSLQLLQLLRPGAYERSFETRNVSDAAGTWRNLGNKLLLYAKNGSDTAGGKWRHDCRPVTRLPRNEGWDGCARDELASLLALLGHSLAPNACLLLLSSPGACRLPL